jgi:SAM-dependent methyltransferase
MNLSEREQLEVERSASEASKIVVKPVQVDRYLNPPPKTPFPLEYAFHLLGEVRGRTVLDLGCGSGENLIPLVHRGAHVIGIDISPELISIAQQRLDKAGLSAIVRVGSAYQTDLGDESVDVVFCMSLIHHLDITQTREEMRRILRPSGFIVLKEPVRFSKGYERLRTLFPSHEDISRYEHPLTREELSAFEQIFEVTGLRYFRLPFVALVERFPPAVKRPCWYASDWILTTLPTLERYATTVALQKQALSDSSPELGP